MSNIGPKLSLVLGGAASGKSAFAEKLVRGAGLPKVYIATAQAFDAEMEAKILKHKTDRGQDWETIEAPLELADAIVGVPVGHIVLVDCLTLWLSNHILAESEIADVRLTLISAIEKSLNPIVFVSNETGLGVVPDNALARKFRQSQGELNQQIAAIADLVMFVSAGLPMILKGTLPEGLR